MLFSILIANYNNEKWVDLCIQSALNQNFNDSEFEVIVCDDASTDDSLISIFRYSNRLKIIENDQNYGVGYTKKKLIDNSIGKYFLFLDSDDYLTEDCLEQFHNHISGIDQEFSMIYGQSVVLKLDGTIVEWKRSKAIKENLYSDTFSYPVFSPVLFVRDAYNKTNGMLEYLRCSEDFDLWYKHEEIGKILFFDSVMYVVRERTDSLTYTSDNLQKWITNVLYQYSVGLSSSLRRNEDSHRLTELFSKIILNRVDKHLLKKNVNTGKDFSKKIKMKIKKLLQ